MAGIRGLNGGEFAARAQAAYPSLSRTDQRVLETMLNDPEAVVRGSVTELARRAGVSQSSAVRTCQRLGFRGYQDVKVAITRDLADLAHREDELTYEDGVDSQSSASEIIDRIFRRSGAALVDAARTIDADQLAAAVDRIAVASRLLVVGNGTSAAPAHDAGYRFAILGIPTTAPTDVMAQHLGARHLDVSGVCVVISHTGASRETLLTAEAAKATGAFLVGITSFNKSPLTRTVDACLVAGGPEYGFRMEAMASRLAHLAVVDALFVGVAVRRPQASIRALDLMADITVDHSL